MPALADASLSDLERTALDRVVNRLAAELGARLRAVWLYGSRARGEPPRGESDVDLLVVLDARRWQDDWAVRRLVSEAAEEVGADPLVFSTQVYDVATVSERRAIGSFFFQEVDRDRIVLFGERDP